MTIGIIPRWGRTSEHVLELLGQASGRKLDDVIQIIGAYRSHSSQEPAIADGYLQSLRQQGYHCFSLYPDRNRAGHPDRVGLRSLELIINGVNVKIEGDEPHNESSLIRLDLADFAFVGLDDLLVQNQPWMREKGRHVRTWGNHNYQLESQTDVMVAGSARVMYTHTNEGRSQRLQDFIGLFLIGNPKRRPVTNTNPNVFNGTVPIFVQGRYEGVVLNAYPNAKTVVVENVEDAVAETSGSYGIEHVQTGTKAKKKNLIVYGAPLVLSETLLVVNYGHFKKNYELQTVVEALKPQGFYDADRVDNFVDWHITLGHNLGENWVGRPSVRQMFVTDEDVAAGARPYNIKSHGWKASDTLPAAQKNEQMGYVQMRLEQLCGVYADYLLGRNDFPKGNTMMFQLTF